MGVFVFKPLTQIHFGLSFFFFFFFFFFFLVEPQHDVVTDIGDITTSNHSSRSPPPPPYHQEQPDTSPFRPSIGVIVGVLTTMFSITFLLLLYAKHCKHGSVVIYSNAGGGYGGPTTSDRKNSGIDRAVVESLPLFRFGSLRGQKDGLECAVCLTRFNPAEVLRLLPKCKHAFHVECVDTWLDSHSTCPLCRYRVDPEDILLLQDVNMFHHHPPPQSSPQRQDLGLDTGQHQQSPACPDQAESNHPGGFRRVSGRHSSAGERGSRVGNPTSSCRRSLDSVKLMSESVAVGCFDRPRKDGLLLTDGLVTDRKSFERRFGHRIIVSAGFHQRWSDVQPSDLLYLRSEMIISDSHRFSSGSSRPSVVSKQRQPHTNVIEIENSNSGSGSGSGVINTRSVSEITGLSRFSARESNGFNRNHRQRQEGLVSRWLAWISSQAHSHPHPHPHVRSDANTHTSTSV